MPGLERSSTLIMEKARGIVTRVTKLGDTSLIVHWCSREAGLIKTVAKAARRATSPFAGKLDLFVEAELVWSQSRKSDLHILKEVEGIPPPSSLISSKLSPCALPSDAKPALGLWDSHFTANPGDSSLH